MLTVEPQICQHVVDVNEVLGRVKQIFDDF